MSIDIEIENSELMLLEVNTDAMVMEVETVSSCATNSQWGPRTVLELMSEYAVQMVDRQQKIKTRERLEDSTTRFETVNEC